MPVEIVMPKIGLTMTEGVVVEWNFKEGDAVNQGDFLLVLETEKVTYEVEAPASGILARILVQDGETVPVGTVIGFLVQEGEDIADLPQELLPAVEETLDTDDQAAGGTPQAAAPTGVTLSPEGGRIKVSPLARKIAKANGIDLVNVAGTGPGGRILKADVEAYEPPVSTVQSTHAVDEAPGDKLVPFTGMRRAIAKKMLSSKIETAQTYMSVSVDATKIKAYREVLMPRIEAERGVRVTITDVMMKITGAAIQKHPVINTRWTDEGVLYLADVHMGMAMALEEGLIVPVIRDINKKCFGQIAVDRTELIRKGKANQFMPDDISGSTFTLSAMGMFGIEQFTSNINLPENAILAVGAIIDKPVVIGGEIAIRPMMTITLSYDHRAIDGAEAGKFMQTLKAFCENPIQVLA